MGARSNRVGRLIMVAPKLRDDLLTGANAIADYLGWPVRRIYHPPMRKRLGLFQVGAILMGRKSELNRVLSGTNAATESELSTVPERVDRFRSATKPPRSKAPAGKVAKRKPARRDRATTIGATEVA